METSSGVAAAKVILPVRIWKGLCVGVKDILGQLMTTDFWVKLFKICAKEMVSAFLKTLGGKFLTYGISREDPEVKKAAQTVTAGSGGAAFSSGYTPRSEFNRGGGGEFGSQSYRQYPVPVPNTPEQNFPGFGK
jgi:hypothetical protein